MRKGKYEHKQCVNFLIYSEKRRDAIKSYRNAKSNSWKFYKQNCIKFTMIRSIAFALCFIQIQFIYVLRIVLWMQKPGPFEICVCECAFHSCNCCCYTVCICSIRFRQTKLLPECVHVYWAPKSQKRTPNTSEKSQIQFCHSLRLFVQDVFLHRALTLLIYSEVSPKLSLNPEIFANQQ